jgi:serine/threonine protein kinase
MAAKKPASRPRFGNWESIHPIGVGAFGVAIKARHVQSNKFAVLKFLQPTRKATDPEEIARELKRFEKEKNRLAQFDSKYISKFYDADLSHNPPWIALQYFAGTTVLEEIQQNGPIDEKKWFEMGHDILSALSYIHGEGVIHRDLNPKNVMLVPTSSIPEFALDMTPVMT